MGGSSGSDQDVVVVNAGATLNAVDIIGFTATTSTKNDSTNANNAVLNAKDGQNVTINVSAATGSSKAFKIVGGTGLDILTGGAGADIISGGGAIDTIVGNGGLIALQAVLVTIL